MTRLSVDEMLLQVAATFALRSTCSRGQAGTVLALDGRVLSSGYNGAPSGMPHCDHTCDCDIATRRYLGPPRAPVDVPHSGHRPTCRQITPCTTAVHAEANAIAFAAKNGVPVGGATLYTTLTPCLNCAQLIINAGIKVVYASQPYRDPTGKDLLVAAGVTCIAMWEEKKVTTREVVKHAPGCCADDPYPCTCGASYG